MKTDAPQLTFLRPDTDSEQPIPVAADTVAAGFPSPAEDYFEASLDLNRALIRNPASTFFVRVSGDSMKDAGIDDGDLLIVDKAAEPHNGCVAVCFIDGEFTLKRLQVEGGNVRLIPANDRYRPIDIHPGNDFAVWGVVTYSIKRHA